MSWGFWAVGLCGMYYLACIVFLHDICRFAWSKAFSKWAHTMYKHNTSKTFLVLKRFASCVAVFKSYRNNFDCQVVTQVQLLTQVFTSFDRHAVEALQPVADRVSHSEAM